MTDQNFQVPPLPPQAPSFTPSTELPRTETATNSNATAQTVATPATVSQPETMEIPVDNFATALKLPVSIYKTKIMMVLLLGAITVGLLFGAMMFGGGTAAAPQGPQGLLGVVPNPDIRMGENIGRCGMVSENSPCIVYIVNHSRNDKRAGDFFAEAIRLTGRQEYMVQIENKQYVNALIAPGYIAQIKIPARY